MSKKIKSISVLFIVCLVMMGASLKVDALFDGNGIGNGYCPPNDPNCPTKPSAERGQALIYAESMETLVEKAGAAILGANADYLDVLRMVEAGNVEGMNYSAIIQRLSDTVAKLKTALDNYQLLIAQAEITPYNPVFINGLRTFDYSGYMKEFGLNPVIFNDLKVFLSEGDLTGLLWYNQRRLYTLYKLALQLKAEALEKGVPGLSKLWWVNERFCDYNLFGQYSSRVFLSL